MHNVRGEGTRLRPLTFERPKPCIPIVNRPSIQHLVSHLSNMGFREVVLTLGYMGNSIEEALGDGSLFGVEITYVHEKTKSGTAGSVKNAQRYLDGHDFLVVGGDHVTDLNVLEFYRAHQKEKATTTIGLISIDDPVSTVLLRSMLVMKLNVSRKSRARRDLLQSRKHRNVHLQP